MQKIISSTRCIQDFRRLLMKREVFPQFVEWSLEVTELNQSWSLITNVSFILIKVKNVISMKILYNNQLSSPFLIAGIFILHLIFACLSSSIKRFFLISSAVASKGLFDYVRFIRLAQCSLENNQFPSILSYCHYYCH